MGVGSDFYRASYASAVLAVIGCPSVRPSVTSRSCTKMAKPRIKLRTAYDSPGTLGFRCQKSRRNSNDITPNGGAKWRWGRFESGDLHHRTTLPLRPPQYCIRPRWPTPTTRLRWRSEAYCYQQRPLEVDYSSCLYQLAVCEHGSVCISRAFCNFWHSAALALSPERQSARMSKIKNGGLDQYGEV